MNITDNIILIDTNILTDLNIAGVLEEFTKLNNIRISDMVKHDEIKQTTGDLKFISKIKEVKATTYQIFEMSNLSTIEKKLSQYDLINVIIARDKNYYLATGDKKLKEYVENKNIKVIRTIKIIELLSESNIITKKQELKAYNNLKENPKTRIPKEELNKRIKRLEEKLYIAS